METQSQQLVQYKASLIVFFTAPYNVCGVFRDARLYLNKQTLELVRDDPIIAQEGDCVLFTETLPPDGILYRIMEKKRPYGNEGATGIPPLLYMRTWLSEDEVYQVRINIFNLTITNMGGAASNTVYRYEFTGNVTKIPVDKQSPLHQQDNVDDYAPPPMDYELAPDYDIQLSTQSYSITSKDKRYTTPRRFINDTRGT